MDDSDLHNAFHDEASVGEDSILSVIIKFFFFRLFPRPHDFSRDAPPSTADKKIQTRGIEAFTRKVTTTASHLAGHAVDPSGSHYHNAMGHVHKQLTRPAIQRRMFSMARTSPTDLVRSKFSTSEIQSRALSYLSDEMLQNIPEDENAYSLFQGFQASFPDIADDSNKRHRRRASRGRKMIEESPTPANSPQHLHKLKKERSTLMHELEMLAIRKNMASSEIREIDNKIANLTGMRRIILDRLADLEHEESLLEHDSKSWRVSRTLFSLLLTGLQSSTWKTG